MTKAICGISVFLLTPRAGLSGCGLVRAARVPISGRERVAKFIASVASHFWTGMTLEWAETNGQSSVLMLRNGTPVVLVTLNASAEGIDQILSIMRPSKLAAVSTSGQRVGEPYPPGPAAN
jgi:hypothetical protein